MWERGDGACGRALGACVAGDGVHRQFLQRERAAHIIARPRLAFRTRGSWAAEPDPQSLPVARKPKLI